MGEFWCGRRCVYQCEFVCICHPKLFVRFWVCMYVFRTDNENEHDRRERAILWLITKLMTHYAPVDMRHGRHTHTQVKSHTNTHTEIMASLLRCSHNVPDCSAAWQWDSRVTMLHINTHTHTEATDREPHQTGFNEVTSPKQKSGRKEGWEEEGNKGGQGRLDWWCSLA